MRVAHNFFDNNGVWPCDGAPNTRPFQHRLPLYLHGKLMGKMLGKYIYMRVRFARAIYILYSTFGHSAHHRVLLRRSLLSANCARPCIRMQHHCIYTARTIRVKIREEEERNKKQFVPNGGDDESSKKSTKTERQLTIFGDYAIVACIYMQEHAIHAVNHVIWEPLWIHGHNIVLYYVWSVECGCRARRAKIEVRSIRKRHDTKSVVVFFFLFDMRSRRWSHLRRCVCTVYAVRSGSQRRNGNITLWTVNQRDTRTFMMVSVTTTIG